jgi:hypothetical protein
MRIERSSGLLLAGCMVAVVFPARADKVQRWVDEKGELHYTNAPSSIPPKFRSQARSTEGRPLASPGDDAPRAQPSLDEIEEVANPTPERPERPEAREKRWREAFQAANEQIAKLEKQIASDRQALADPADAGLPVARAAHGGIRPSPEYEAVRARLQAAEGDLVLARGRLEELERKAARESVPLEWRR